MTYAKQVETLLVQIKELRAMYLKLDDQFLRTRNQRDMWRKLYQDMCYIQGVEPRAFKKGKLTESRQLEHLGDGEGGLPAEAGSSR